MYEQLKSDNYPEEFYVVVEISPACGPVKYEFSKEQGVMMVRFPCINALPMPLWLCPGCQG